MQRRRLIPLIVLALLLLPLFSRICSASITLITGGPGCTHVGNLVTNGSFEIGAPPSGIANQQYWATGTTFTPFSSPAGWTTSGAGANYAVWGNDGSPASGIKGSDAIPDGNAALYMGNGTFAFVTPAPNFNPDGSVTFASAPTFFPKYGLPVTLTQSIPTNLTPAPSYEMCFWASGEDAQTGVFTGAPGILELDVTNVDPSGPVQLFVSVPNGSSPQPLSHVYEYNFTPVNPSLPVQIEFLNWGHLTLQPYGGPSLVTEAIVDDVIVNALASESTPEPGSISLLLGAVFLRGVLRRRRG